MRSGVSSRAEDSLISDAEVTVGSVLTRSTQPQKRQSALIRQQKLPGKTLDAYVSPSSPWRSTGVSRLPREPSPAISEEEREEKEKAGDYEDWGSGSQPRRRSQHGRRSLVSSRLVGAMQVTDDEEDEEDVDTLLEGMGLGDAVRQAEAALILAKAGLPAAASQASSPGSLTYQSIPPVVATDSLPSPPQQQCQPMWRQSSTKSGNSSTKPTPMDRRASSPPASSTAKGPRPKQSSSVRKSAASKPGTEIPHRKTTPAKQRTDSQHRKSASSKKEVSGSTTSRKTPSRKTTRRKSRSGVASSGDAARSARNPGTAKQSKQPQYRSVGTQSPPPASSVALSPDSTQQQQHVLHHVFYHHHHHPISSTPEPPPPSARFHVGVEETSPPPGIKVPSRNRTVWPALLFYVSRACLQRNGHWCG